MRKWHRLVSLPAFVFLLVVSISGLVLQVQSFFNDDEEKSEQLKSQNSKIFLKSSMDYSSKLEAAQKVLLSKIGNVDIKKIEVELRQTPPIFSFYVDQTHPKVFQINSETGQILSEKDDNADNFWIKLHSGEIFGDAGRSTGIFSGLALLFLTLSGFWVYVQMFRRRPKVGPALKRFFW